jgi:glycosyltransferase involved in cell wall biosynthesis
VKLLIDAQPLQSPRSCQRGIGRYGFGLVRALTEHARDWRIELVENASLPPISLAGFPVRHIEPPLGPEVHHRCCNELFYGDWLCGQRPDAVLFLNHFDDGLLTPRFVGDRPRLISLCFDLIPLLFARHYLRTARTVDSYGRGFRALLASDRVLTISQAVQDDLLRLVPHLQGRAGVIGGAVDSIFAPPSPHDRARLRDRLARRFGLSREYIFCVGGDDVRKNLPMAIRAFAGLPSSERAGLDLVIACSLAREQRQLLESTAGELSVHDSLKLTGAVSDTDLRALYGMCRLFFFPSLCEGLGLPVLEALRCGAPVICGNGSALAECAGPGAWLVDPTDVKDCTRGLLEALRQPRDLSLAKRLDHAGRFTWKTVAARAIRAIEGPLPVCSRPRRKRIAWVSPLPPASTGIADYTNEILPHLADRFEIDLVIDPSQPSPTDSLVQRHSILAPDDMARIHENAPYDAIIYQLGNSHHHLYQLALLGRFRGMVVLHDCFLGGLIQAAINAGCWPRSLARELELAAEPSLANALAVDEIRVAEIVEQVPLNASILARAGTILVHSRWALERIRPHFVGPIGRLALPVANPPLGPRLMERQRLGLSSDRVLIASLGTVGPSSRLASLISALGQLPRQLRARCDCWVVGPAGGLARAELERMAREASVADQVRFTGRIDLRDFAAFARAADCCVQLRWPSRGESSAALVRALLAAAPCIVSDSGPSAEIPEDCALKVRSPGNEVSDLVTGLARLLGDAALSHRLGIAAANFATVHHSPARIAEPYGDLIETAIVERSRDAWLEAACESLADVEPGRAQSLIEPWAHLRLAGQRSCSPLPPSGELPDGCL